MGTPTDNWEMKVLKYLFGHKLIVRVETTYFIFKSLQKTSEVAKLREDISSTLLRNVVIGTTAGLLVMFMLKRNFPTYRENFSFTNLIVDASVYMLFTGGATLWSLYELEDTIDPFRRKWIREHHPGYLQKMREIQRNYNITILQQIQGYVKSNERIRWKNRYDGLIP